MSHSEEWTHNHDISNRIIILPRVTRIKVKLVQSLRKCNEERINDKPKLTLFM